MLLHRLFSVFLCAHSNQDQETAILELSYPDDQSEEVVRCKVFHNYDGICWCVLERQHIVCPKLSLDPRTLFGKASINANGWMQKADTLHQGFAAIPGIDRAARTSQSLSGPVSVYFVLQLEIPIPPPVYNSKAFTFALGSNVTLFSYDDLDQFGILEVQNTAGVDILPVDSTHVKAELWHQGKHLLDKIISREKSDTGQWALDVGVFIDFQNKQIAFVNVEQSVLISRLQGIETSQPLFSLLQIIQSRARISSGKEVHISGEIKALLLQNIS